MDDKLTEKTFLLYAAKWYDNPQCTEMTEFYDDLKRFNYLKRLFNRFQEDGEIKERLVLNHLVVLFNVFGPKTVDMLFLKLKEHYSCLKPFLILLQRMPDYVYVDNKKIDNVDILMDQRIVDLLRKI